MFKKIKEFFFGSGGKRDIIERKEVTIHDRPGDKPEDNPFKTKGISTTNIKIQLFKDKSKKWRFRLLAANHKILCDSEAYQRKSNCKETAELIKNSQFAVTEK